jgi:hypothetical protein
LDALRRSFRNTYVRIAIQLDGPGANDTRRMLIAPGTAASPPQITYLDMPEQAMDDPNTLVKFIQWGQDSFPAAHYYLAIANHGQAIQGIAWDTTSDLADDKVLDDSAYLTVRELGQALGDPRVAPIDVLHLDACSMNLLEVAYEVRQRTQVLIASQYLGWSYFAYDEYQGAMGEDTAPDDVARDIAARYAARAGADLHPYTIAALDLRRADPTLRAVDALAAELTALMDDPGNRALLQRIWHESRKFESNGDYLNSDLDMYMDLLDWASRVQRDVNHPGTRTWAATLIGELTRPQSLIIAGSNRARSNSLPPQYAGGAYIDLTGSNGLSIFYPQRRDTAAFDSYVNDRLFTFTGASRWPDFLVAGLGALPAPGPYERLPGPLAPLGGSPQVFLPLVSR